jgi:GNAT superfamily N-acetyltransferase
MQIRIADKRSDAGVLAHLFAANLSPQYISHSELQGYRALAPSDWAPDIESVLRREIEARLKEPLERLPTGKDWQGVLEAHEDDRLIGISFITLIHSAAVPFGVIEDIVVEQALRGEGRGEHMMQWILQKFAEAGVRRAFLESGLGNEGAHHLFERLGFRTTSIVMMREL